MELSARVERLEKQEYLAFFTWLHALLRNGNVESYENSSSELQMVGRIQTSEDPAELARSFQSQDLETLSVTGLPGGEVGFNAGAIVLRSASAEWLIEQQAGWKTAGGDAARFRFEASARVPLPGDGWPPIFRTVRWILAHATGDGSFQVRWYDDQGFQQVLALPIAGAPAACSHCDSVHRASVCARLHDAVVPDGISSLECSAGPRLAALLFRDRDCTLRAVAPELPEAIRAVDAWV